MSIEELEYKESRLRKEFMDKLEWLDTDGENDIHTIKCIKTYGALWHYTHQLLLAELETKPENNRAVTTADTVNIQATGLQMKGATK